MRRARLFVAGSAAGTLALVAYWVFLPGEVPAQFKKPLPPAGKDAKAVQGAALPIAQVVLFSSGVSYYQREGEVNGNATMDLSFPVRDINDLLKSLVLQDLGGGQIRTVGYDSFDPVDKTLKSFALDLTANPTFADLLQQARGEQAEVDWQAQTLKGAIVGVDKRRQAVVPDLVLSNEVEMLTILTDTGLRSLPLNQVQRVRFLNQNVDAELKRALEVLAQTHDTHKRTVSFNFAGQGKRPVKVGYVIESPIWKTTYRLVLGKDGKPFLQGWAIVDNASDEDWKNVQVTLVSGRPISYQMNLYQPLYVDRPWQQLEMFANLRPQVYASAMDKTEKDKEQALLLRPMAGGFGGFGGMPGGGGLPPKLPVQVEGLPSLGAMIPKSANPATDMQKSVTADVAGTEVGQFFQYAIKQPVSLARQRSALLPIVNQEVEGKRFSIYNAAVQPKHPLLGLKLKNTTDSHLMQGPITVFEGASYAGDARIMDLQPNEDRLISYAIDQGVEVEPVAKSAAEELVAVKVVKGVLHATYKLRETKTYNVKNRSNQDRELLIEHPFRADWKLLDDKAAERSRDVYRFHVSVPAGKSATQTVVEELSRVDQVALTNADDQAIRLFLQSKTASAKIKDALVKAVAYRVKLADIQREMAQVDTQIKTVAEDQARIRANMERVPQNSAPYQRYLKKLDEQETQIEGLQEQVRVLRRRVEDQRREYEGFLLGLTLED